MKFTSDEYDKVTKEIESLQLKTNTVDHKIGWSENKQLKAEVFSLRNYIEIQKGITTNNLEQHT